MVERVKALEHAGYQFEAADGSFDLLIRKETGDYEPLFRLESWRVIAEKREDGRVQTEATIKIWVDGERYVRTAEGNGPVNALDRALRDALVETHPHLRDIRLTNFKVRILDETKGTEAVTRVLLDASDGVDTWGAIGVSENVIESSWEALVDSLEAGMLPRHAGHAPSGRDGVSDEFIPLARPAIGAREEELVLEVLRSRQLSLGPRLDGSSRKRSPPGSASSTSPPCRAAPPGFTSRSARSAWRRATRSSPRRSASSPRRTRSSTRARGRCSATSTARTLNLDPEAAAAAVTERTAGILPVHIFGYPADMPAFERIAGEHGLWLVEDACEALGAEHARRRARGRARAPGRLRLLSEQAGGDGGGRRRRLPGRRDEGAHRQRAQPGPRAGHGMARPRPARASTTASRTSRARSGSPSSSGSTTCSRRGRGWRPPIASASRGIEGLELPCPDSDGDRRSWFVYVVQLPTEVDRDEHDRADAGAGVDSKPYLPAIHLMSFYRERFGHREGEFPVCEEVSRRSLALPFYPELTEGQVERVTETLVGIIESSAPGPRSTGSSAETPSSSGRAASCWPPPCRSSSGTARSR